MNVQEFKIPVGEKSSVSAILTTPKTPAALFVCAHGAGTNMRHRFLESLASLFSQKDIAVLRYNFLYTENGKKKPDFKNVLLNTVRSVVGFAQQQWPQWPVFAGGKSMGGRMTSLTVSENKITNLQGLIFIGFPLHPAGEPSTERAEHLFQLHIPSLFLQGSRDSLADLSLLKPVLQKLDPLPQLSVFENADHSFHVPKKSGKTDVDVLSEVAAVTAAWIRSKL